MALTRVEVYLKTMNDIAKCKSKIGAVKFKIDCLEDILQNPDKEFTEADIATLQKELNKLKKDFVYPSPEDMKFYYKVLDAFVNETDDEHRERLREYLTVVINETERYGSEGIKTIKRTLAEHEPK